jgi:uncharacterized repeat protein (TIGR01451 family)
VIASRTLRRPFLALLAATCLTVLSGGVAVAAGSEVEICHATMSNGHPYEVNSPSKSGDVSGHADHNGPIWGPTLKANHVEWGDIIPPFSYVENGVTKFFPGHNWSALGQEIFRLGCELPPPTLTVDKTNDANDNGTFTNSEVATAAGSDVTFRVTVTNTSFYTVVIKSITDVVGVTSIPVSCAAAFVGQTLAVGGSKTCTFTVANYSPADGGSKTNTATVTVHQTGDTGNDASDSDTSIVSTDVPAPDITVSVTKKNDANGDTTYSVTETAPTAGATVPFRAVITNTSDVTVTLAGITDAVGGAAAVPLTCSLPATLAAGASATCSFTGTSPAAGTSLSDTVTVTVHEVGDSTNDDTASATSTVHTQALPLFTDLRIVKQGPSGDLLPGEQAAYTLTVHNDGNTPATSVVVNDAVPAGTTLQSLTASGWTCIGAGVSCTLNTPLAAGGSASLSLVLALSESYAPSTLTNTGVVTPTDDTPDNNTSSVTNPVLHAPDLAVLKQGPAGPVEPGTELSYTITVTNNGNADATSVVVNDAIPTGTTLDTLTATGWTCVGAGISCTLNAALAPDASASMTVVLDLAADYLPATVVNTAIVSPTDATPEDNTSTVTTPVSHAPDLAVVKTGPASVVEGSTITWTIEVTNNGDAAATSVVVTDAIPAGLTPGTVSAAGWTCTGTASLSCTLNSSLAIDGKASFTVSAGVPVGYVPSTISNTAVVGPPDETPEDNTSTVETDVTAPDLEVVKTGPDSVAVGSSISWSITVTNNGNAPATSVVLTDELPAGLTPGTVTAAGWTCSGTTSLSCTLDSALAPDGSASLTVTAGVPAGYVPDSVSNTAMVGPTDETPEDNTSTTVTDVTRPDLAVVKTGPASVVAGTAITWTITVTNNGNATANSVVVTDDLPAGLTPGTVTAAGWTCAGTTSLSCALDTALAPDGTASFTVTAGVPAGYVPNAVTNTAVVGPPDTTPEDNTSTVTTTVTRPIQTGGSGGGGLQPPATPPFTGGGGGLVFTGAPIGEWIILATCALSVGAFLVLMGRRRTTTGLPPA